MADTANLYKLSFASLSKTLDVREVDVVDPISDLFEVRVTADAQDTEIDFDTVVGKGAAVKVVQPSVTRAWSGICASVVESTRLGKDGASRISTYEFSIRPTLWRTTLRTNNRIFQHLSIPEIVDKLLKEWTITPEKKIQGTYKQLEYVVQYDETDYDFIKRLLEQAGITFFFKQAANSGSGEDVTKLVLNDAPHASAPRSGPLPYIAQLTGRSDPTDFVTEVTIGNRHVTGARSIRDYDFRKRPDTQLIANSKADGLEAKYEDYEYRPNAFWIEPGSSGGPSTPVADDQGKARSDDKEASAIVKRELAGLRNDRTTVTFATVAIDLSAGMVMAIGQESANAHPRKDLSPSTKLLILESRFRAAVGAPTQAYCRTTLAKDPYFPRRETPRPRISGIQSAMVVGPSGKEIYTDEFGRVRVQFHWDREGKYDEKSSCWVRVSQAWAGSRYGTITIPRVGHEVLVEFLDGDPDCPMIVGRVYNGTAHVPYALPDAKTRSGWKTDSSPRTGGFNELMFEDLKDKELIHVQAQKDMTAVVKNDVTQDIGRNRTLMIKKDDATEVGEKHTISVGPSTGSIMTSDKKIIITTGSASITYPDDKVLFNASGSINVHAGAGLTLSAAGGDVTIDAPLVRINSGVAIPPIVATVNAAKDPKPLDKVDKSKLTLAAHVTVDPPKPLEDVSVK